MPNNDDFDLFDDMKSFFTLDALKVCSPIILAIIAIVFEYYVNGNVSVLDATLTVGGILIADRLILVKGGKRIMNKINTIYDRSKDLHFVGSTDLGIIDINKNIIGATEVFNTVFRPRAGEGRYREGHISSISAIMNSALSDDCEWKDLICGDAGEFMRGVYNKLSVDRREQQYHAFSIKDDIHPLFQMILVQYDPSVRDPVVWFGWSFKESSGSLVYRTSDPEAIRYFRSYWDVLRSSASPLEHAGLTLTQLTDFPEKPVPVTRHSPNDVGSPGPS